MNVSKLMLALAATSLLVVGCSTQKKPATEALSAVESSLAAIKDDAAKYAPDGLKGVESTLASLKESLAKEDYKSVLAGTPQLGQAVDSLKEAIAAGKQQAEASLTEWTSLNATVPQMVEAIQSRVDILSKSKKLPKNISGEAFDAAKSGLDSMKAKWTEASADFTAGNASAAADKAREVKRMGEEVLQKLGMTSG